MERMPAVFGSEAMELWLLREISQENTEEPGRGLL